MNECRKACATKVGRAAMMTAVKAMAAEIGATIEAPDGIQSPRRVGLYICMGPYRCMMHFDGESRVDAFLGHWFIEERDAASFPDNFGAIIGGSINQYHKRKATTCQDSFVEFLGCISDGLKCLKEAVLAPA